MTLASITSLLAPFFGTVLSIISSFFSVIASTFTFITPVLTGISEFIVWFVKSFFQGLYAITQNLNTLTVIIVIVAISLLYLYRLDTANLIDQVHQQKAYDARHPQPHVLKPRPVQKKTTNNGCDLCIF